MTTHEALIRMVAHRKEQRHRQGKMGREYRDKMLEIAEQALREKCERELSNWTTSSNLDADRLINLFAFSEDEQVLNRTFRFVILREDAKLVAKTLREAREREKGCEYCLDDTICPLDWQYGLDHIFDYEFCPMCGRRLSRHEQDIDQENAQ